MTAGALSPDHTDTEPADDGPLRPLDEPDPGHTSGTADTTSDLATDTGGLGRLMWIDPRELIIGPNTRRAPRLDRGFVSSIRHDGVREPIKVHRRRSDGRLCVHNGQRRTAAALKVGLDRVRVLIEDQPAVELDAAAADQAARIVDQLCNNDLRAPITLPDEVIAHQMLLRLGLSPAMIARRTHTGAARVRATTAIARSETAMAMLPTAGLDLLHLAAISEFDDDPDAAAELQRVALADPGQFDHTAARLRNERNARWLRDARAAELRAAGITVLDSAEPAADPDQTSSPMELIRLRPAPHDLPGTDLDDDAHRSCPGHAVGLAVYPRRNGFDIAEVPWCVDPLRYGHCGLWEVAADPVEQPSPSPAPPDLDVDAPDRSPHGDRSRAGSPAQPSPIPPPVDAGGPPNESGRTVGSGAPADQHAQARERLRAQLAERTRVAETQRAAAERAAAAAAAAARRDRAIQTRSRIRDAAAVAAEGVRRQWLATLLGRKQPPKDAARYCAITLATAQPGFLDREGRSGHPLACTLLGVDQPPAGSGSSGGSGGSGGSDFDGHPVTSGILAVLQSATTARVTQATLAMILAAQESGVLTSGWSTRDGATAAYLEQLQAWGYDLSPVERLMLDPDADIHFDGDPDPTDDPDDPDDPDTVEIARQDDGGASTSEGSTDSGDRADTAE